MRTIGIVAAQVEEAAHLIRNLDNPRGGWAGPHDVFQGDIGDKVVSIIISGVGRWAARGAAEALIEKARPDLVISTGFAGGLVEEFSAGTIVVSHQIVSDAGGRETFPTLDRFLPPPPGKTGVVLTCCRFVSSAAHKRELHSRFGAVAVDMESFYVGCAARKAGIPFLVVRVISDDLSHELPVMAEVFGKEERVDFGRAIPYFVRHPRTLFPFVRFMKGLSAHADALSQYLEKLITFLS